MKDSQVISPMPRILYVITKAAPMGGAQKYVYDLAVAARDRGYGVVVAVGGTGALVDRLEAAHIRVVALPLAQQRSFIADLLTFGSLVPLVRLMRRERPDVVHVNSAKAGGLGALAARIAGVRRIIFTAHGWEFNAPRSFFSRAGIRLFSWLTVLLSHSTIAVSDAIRRDTRWWPFVSHKIVVIRNGLTCPTRVPRDEARATLAPRTVGRYWIGIASELSATKRVEDAINAFAQIAPRHPDAILVIMGDGREREALESLVRDLHLSLRVSFLGFVPDAATLFAAFDLFVHTSRSEALGYAILEAGCASLPVVATKVGGVAEIIPDAYHGVLVRREAPEQVAAAMESLMNDPRRAAEIGARLHARVAHAFSTARMLAETLALYVN